MTPGELAAKAALTRPRIADEREAEIVDAAVRVLAKVGYDRLTMDQVAAEARASKASLYRHWSSKAELVVDAISRAKGLPDPEPPDTGSLRSDLRATWCGKTSWSSKLPMSVISGLMTAIHTDAEFGSAFRTRFLGPRLASGYAIVNRAKQRGEVSPEVDADILLALLPALSSHFGVIHGREVDDAFIERLIDEVVLPVARCNASPERGSGEAIS